MCVDDTSYIRIGHRSRTPKELRPAWTIPRLDLKLKGLIARFKQAEDHESDDEDMAKDSSDHTDRDTSIAIQCDKVAPQE